MTAIVSNLLSLIFKAHPRENKYKLPLPKQCHVTLSDDVIGDKAMFIIGDIHGCFDELVELMNQARSLERNVLFLFVGDLVNKGPKSVDVIRLLRSMGKDAWSVRGNHDEATLREVRSMRNDSGYSVPERYYWIKDLSDDDINYLSQLPYTISVPSHKITIVHAGIIPGLPLESQKLNNLTNMRNIIEPDDPFSCTLTASNKTDKGSSWAAHWPGPDHVYFGHDARRRYQDHPYATGLDTGCVYGGELTGTFSNGRTLAVPAKCCHSEPD